MKAFISFDKIKENIASWGKAFVSDKKKVAVTISCIVLFAVYAVLGAVSRHIIAGLPDQLGAQRWSEDMTMAQISLFLTQDQKATEDDIRRFNYILERKLLDAGVTDLAEEEDSYLSAPRIIDTIGIEDMYGNKAQTPSEEDDGIRNLYTVSYCAQGQATLSFENRTLENAAAIGAGGDFFIFHPLTLISGTYFDGDDIMKDKIVIDEDTAWQLFGSTDIIGQSVMISEVPHYIVGVVKKDTGKLNEAAGLSKSYVYMSYDSLTKYGTILSGVTEPTEVSEDGVTASIGGINCVEVLCPNPVKGLAVKLCKESLVSNEDVVVAIDNTDRFSAFALFSVLKNFFTRSMWGKAIFYPYWENVARGYEDILALILLVRTIALIALVIILVVVVVNLYRHKKWTVRGIVNFLSEKKYDLEVKHNQKKHQKMIDSADNP
ncbi:hypothetical protein D6855_02625 [Butyrivibrio sp. CB08]|uniref:ABC transporter permease n=1 Tax=Butyrivibrio sp. CB08 TaxID=2364879 RepID=UPI000EA920FD|nr:ABC transporter permease [Butyrivibrio sp. CB08]RKM62331.1 hypothetical protein D6855_02625 [Butyrivibrio sp. CB08]